MRVVSNVLPERPDSVILSIDPALAIGHLDGSPEETFGGIAGAALLSDGSIAVADFRTSDVRLFRSDGVHQVTMGGEGDGPGELRFLGSIWVTAGDSIVVGEFDGLTLFDRTGGYIRSLANSAIDGPTPYFVAQSGNGDLLGVLGTRELDPFLAGVLQRDTARLVAYSPSGRMLAGLRALPTGETWVVQGTPELLDVPFSARPSWGAGVETFLMATGRSAEVERRDPSGSLIEVIRWTQEDRPVTNEIRDRYRAHLGASGTPGLQAAHERLFRDAPVPEQLPVLAPGLIHEDPDGRLWVQVYRLPWESERWNVFATSGSFLARVVLPPSVRMVDLGPGSLLGVFTNDLGVAFVHLYRFELPPG